MMKDQENPQAVNIIEHKREKKSIYYKKLPLPSVPSRLMEKSDLLAAQIHKLVAQMSAARRQAKAERHIYDAYYLRSVRNDIDLLDRKSLKILWSIENHPYWQTLLFIISLIYQILTFFEQPFPVDEPENGNLIMVELVILIFFLSDVTITIILMATKPAEGKFNLNLKRALNITLVIFCFSDFISYIIDSKQFRFSRIVRPLIMIFHSKDLRRNLGGIVKAGKDLVLLILLYCIVISVFSFIGINLIGTIPDIDLDNQDYGDFFQLFNMLLMVATLDYYPDILLPPMLVSTLYIAFFVIYLLLFIFLFQPIPLAVVYEGFRKHRMQIAINDIIKQKSAMMASFISLDQYDKGYLTEKQFKTFLTCFYRDTLQEEDQQKLFSQIDKDFNDKIQFDEFYQLINIIQNGNTIKMPQWPGFKWWNLFRNFLNRYLKLKKIIDSPQFSSVMLGIVLFNCCTIVTAFFIDDVDTLAVFDLLDLIFLSIFATEIVIKILGLGIRAYFEDGWNVFDISLVALQFLFDYVLFSIIQGNLSQGLKANRILRLAKIQKVFRLFRAFRSIKLIGFLISGFEILGDVKDLLYKIIMCVPLIIRLMLPVQIVFYIFSVMGMYLFGQLNFEDNPYQNNLCYLNGETYQWSNCIYTDFTTLVNAYLMMLQTFIASQWGQTVFLLSHSMKNLWIPMVFMGAFIFSSIFLVALIGGLVWEVFIVVSISLKQEQIMQEEEELLQLESENPLFSSVGTVNELKQTSGNSTATNQRLKKQTQILNDDNPDVIQIRQRSHAMKSRSSREENDYKYYIPQEYTERIKIEQYNLLPAGGSKSASVKRNSRRNSLVPSENELEELKGGILSLYFDQFQSYDQFLNYKFDSENLSIQNISQEYIVHLRNEIKKDEIIQTKIINIQNQDQLIQNAVLRDTTEMQIRLQEEKHFKNLYGQQFERIKELKFQSKFKIESKILFSMMGILKFPKTNIKYFFQILYLIENQLTYQLLPDYSFWKMIHQIDGVWYLINFEEKQIVFTKIKKGPWNYANELFDNTKLRVAENISFIKNQRSVNTKYFLKSFQNSLQMITQLFDIDHKLIHPKSCLMLYDIKNKNFTGDSNRPRTIHRRFKQKRASNFTLDLDEAPNPHNFQFNNSNGSEMQDVKQKFVSRTMMIVLYKNQGIDPRIIFQNQVLLLQFIQDLGTVIENYQHHFFQQIEELYVLRNQIGKIN